LALRSEINARCREFSAGSHLHFPPFDYEQSRTTRQFIKAEIILKYLIVFRLRQSWGRRAGAGGSPSRLGCISAPLPTSRSPCGKQTQIFVFLLVLQQDFSCLAGEDSGAGGCSPHPSPLRPSQQRRRGLAQCSLLGCGSLGSIGIPIQGALGSQPGDHWDPNPGSMRIPTWGASGS